MQHNLVTILGPTASGKTKLAVRLAAHFNGEIISADSRQVFKGMDIGTGKDLQEYQLADQSIPYHLIDIIDAGQKYNVNAFQNDFYHAFEQINQKNKLAILCGGTGMYIHSILQNHELTGVPIQQPLRNELALLEKEQLIEKLLTYAPEFSDKVDYSSKKRLIRAIEIAEYLTIHQLPKIERPKFTPIVIGLANTIENRREKIINRLTHRLNNGLIEEVELLMRQGVSTEILTFYGLEYKYVAAYLSHQFDLPTLQERLGIAICQYAKRQMTFFRKMEKDGVEINWINTADDKLFEHSVAILADNLMK
jgi:tRNA dimethylallyltransferase